MKVGQFVRQHAHLIFDYCRTIDPTEFSRLQDPQYSKDTFDINYPFCRPVSEITPDEHTRYYNATHHLHGLQVRMTSQWFSKSLPLMRQYLTNRGISYGESLQPETPSPTAQGRSIRGRHRGNAIGNAQNAFVRHLLSRIGGEQFSAEQWKSVISEFGQRCAYCDAEGDLVMDHVIPINRTALGEHRLGNLVPACRTCNATKAGQDYRAFLGQRDDRITTINAHMARYDYVPIGENEKLGQIIELAHQDVRQLADRYATIIDTLLAEDDSS